MTPRILRALAIVVAVGGAVDPAVTSNRRTRPEVSVVAADSAHAALATRVARELDDELTIIAAPFGGAAATVVVGDRLPMGTGELAAPVFAIMPVRDEPMVTIESVRVPSRSPLEARVPVGVVARVTGARERTVELTLRAGDVVVDRADREIAGDDVRLHVELALVPTGVGAVPLRVTAAIVGTPGSAAGDALTDIRDQRWAVLFYDPRPSWMSTFVRRAIERDPRFVVTSRVITSRNLSTDAGRPPSTLGDRTALGLFDAIVIGAPEGLSERDVGGLDAYLRRRGGAVVLLLDQRATGAYARLAPVGEWMRGGNPAGVSVTRASSDSGGLRASEIAWPRPLPTGAEAVALSDDRPVIWRAPVGAGRLVVSGALDAWRFRDPAISGFDGFWRALVAEAAAGPPAIDIAIDQPLLRPDEPADVVVTLREASLAEISATHPVRATVAATVETPEGPLAVRLWPDGPVGRFRGRFRAPNAPGVYRVVVSADGMRAHAPIVIGPSVARATADDSDLLGAWAASRGGVALPAARLAELGPAVHRVVQPVSRRETWHPMRSAWWIVPFSLLLGAEWLWRRRRGLV